MPIPGSEREAAEDLLASYCGARVREEIRHLLEITFRFEGNNAYLVERRPSFRRRGKWTEIDLARFRYMVGRREWRLFWSDRNGRWHRYHDRAPARRLATLLKEVDTDPTGIFWG